MEFAHPPHLRYAWLVLASTIAGVMNAMAGGGSFISFPAMLGMGVPPVQANATNTVALWPGQAVSILTLRDDLVPSLVPPVLLACGIGAVCGAEVLLHTQQRTFLRLIPWLILVGTVTFAISGPVARWLQGRSTAERNGIPQSKLAVFLALLPITFYIGYFGAGGGFLTMTVLALFGMENIYQLNALKNVTAGSSNLVAIVTFILSGAVEWRYCLVSMAFAAAGGYVGARLARRTRAEVLRAVVVLTGCAVAAFFFWRNHHGLA